MYVLGVHYEMNFRKMYYVYEMYLVCFIFSLGLLGNSGVTPPPSVILHCISYNFSIAKQWAKQLSGNIGTAVTHKCILCSIVLLWAFWKTVNSSCKKFGNSRVATPSCVIFHFNFLQLLYCPVCEWKHRSTCDIFFLIGVFGKRSAAAVRNLVIAG